MKVEIDPRVDKYIRKLPNNESAKIVSIVEIFSESGFDTTEKYLKKLNKNLWELKTGRRRVLFGVVRSKTIIVQIFAKQSQKTPDKELKTAFKRLNEYC